MMVGGLVYISLSAFVPDANAARRRNQGNVLEDEPARARVRFSDIINSSPVYVQPGLFGERGGICVCVKVYLLQGIARDSVSGGQPCLTPKDGQVSLRS
jgi:hypothetical protein